MKERYLPLSRPEISQAEIGNVVRCLKSGWLTTGKFTLEFEALLKNYLGAKEVVCVDSCTAALHLSLIAHGIGSQDEVITTPFTFAATANVIEHCGARTVFSDINPDTYNIDPDSIVKKITKRTRAIIPVHFAGYPCDLKAIYKLAHKYGIAVIEDAAHAMGSVIEGRKVGSFPGLTCFSFYATKGITTGEGGCVALGDKMIADRIRVLRFHGINKDAWKRYTQGGKWRYDIKEAGYKNNMTDVLAAIGIIQLKKIDTFIQKRRRIAWRYSQNLSGFPGFITPYCADDIVHSWHLYPCRINKKWFGISRDAFISRMDKMGIGASVHYIPLHLHSYYRKKYNYKIGQFPIAEKVGGSIVSIPLFTKMTHADVERVIRAIKLIQEGKDARK